MNALPEADDPLPGGLCHPGAVRRDGEAVERPAPPHALALHAHLRALRVRSFDAAPVPLGPPAAGRERLSYLPGEVAVPPYPAWSHAPGALASVARLLRRYHDAAAAVPPDPSVPWPADLADPEGGPVLCHNDLCLENVVFRGGEAAGLIDFDLAAPGRPLWDLAMAARYWVPVLDPESAAVTSRDHLDVPARLRLFADAYGLPAGDRALLPSVIEAATARTRAFVTAQVAAGSPAFTEAIAAHGGWARWDRLQRWQAAHRSDLRAALVR
ncbi:phosphotransferase [Streptomyces sp. DSM 44917]|uniref:Phosphotransferase n=1 Tax=Streptomyces boetiae TaxID=3075541 RepID=A0ABU2L735_9ACTN|nr:phosphotransferase [Streptomyces sp. DSM 44917]MDT0307381.1 phosphotransferase [Streptomyces sp. DSM 44917]